MVITGDKARILQMLEADSRPTMSRVLNYSSQAHVECPTESIHDLQTYSGTLGVFPDLLQIAWENFILPALCPGQLL
jgi:hypothetical protein